MFKRILAPTDFSTPAEAALLRATELADASGAELHLLHVVTPQIYYAELPEAMLPPIEDFTDQIIEGAQTRLARQVELLKKQKSGLSITAHVQQSGGSVAATVCDFAETIDADLILIASHGRSGLMHLLMGSTSEQIVRHAKRDLFIFRAEDAPV